MDSVAVVLVTTARETGFRVRGSGFMGQDSDSVFNHKELKDHKEKQLNVGC
jgi:hypothetical protein